MRGRLLLDIRILFFGSLGILCALFHSTTSRILYAQENTIIFEDLEHGNLFENDWFVFFSPNGIGSIDLLSGERGLIHQTSWSMRGDEGYIGGFGRTNTMYIDGMTHFTFWINPIKGSQYTLEVNLQEDDNGDGEVSIHDDDEFQYNVIVSDIGQGAIAGAGWQKVSIPLTDFYDDNSYMRGGNGILDAVEGNAKLINVVFAIINHQGEDIEFQTDDWEFNDQEIQTIVDKRILFVGNSYTFYNNMPQIFYTLANYGGKNVYVDQSTFAGYWLDNHISNDHTSHKLQKEDWDYVVIQEQSQVPTVKHWREASMKPAAEVLNSIIKEGGAETVLFMTWGRKYGGEQLLYDYTSSAFSNYNHMQDSLEATYRNLADYLDATLAPVGSAWENALIINPEINLWDDDQSHPTYEGSYLTACVFYAILFQESPVGLAFTGNLDEDMAWFLQSMASTVLADTPNQVVTTN
jgi:hypothetical protein